jgi:hypothetical protein
MYANNATGTLPDIISAFVDITVLSLFANSITGAFPSSAKAWTKLTEINVAQNGFSGGQLPELSYGKMSRCNLVDHTRGGSNSFLCPFAAGITEKCTIFKAQGNWVPITDADCAGPCTGSSTKLALDQCRAWIAFYDATNGDKWIPRGGAVACTRTDPCSCKPSDGGGTYPVCDSTGVTVHSM